MPWTASDAYGHTHQATSPTAQRQWQHVANGMLKSGHSDATAIRAANSVVGKRKGGFHAAARLK